MKKLFFFIVLFLLFSSALFAQIGINTDNSLPDPSAMLDVKSNSKGMLIPRMTASQRTGISSAVTGLLVYQTDAPAGFYYYNGTGWMFLGTGEGGGDHMIDVDGNAYPTVKIGNQEWMAENLRVTHYHNGDAIPKVTVDADWATLTTGARCYYNNDSVTNNPIYGALYNWYTVADSRNLCTTGWHVPTDAEWTTLTTYLGGESIAGGKMKAAILWCCPSIGATNTSGFSGLPGGERDLDGTFWGVTYCEPWWSSNGVDWDPDFAWYRNLIRNNAIINRYMGAKGAGYSVRCVRD